VLALLGGQSSRPWRPAIPLPWVGAALLGGLPLDGPACARQRWWALPLATLMMEAAVMQVAVAAGPTTGLLTTGALTPYRLTAGPGLEHIAARLWSAGLVPAFLQNEQPIVGREPCGCDSHVSMCHAFLDPSYL